MGAMINHAALLGRQRHVFFINQYPHGLISPTKFSDLEVLLGDWTVQISASCEWGVKGVVDIDPPPEDVAGSCSELDVGYRRWLVSHLRVSKRICQISVWMMNLVSRFRSLTH
jgi:hypothetical protein